MVKEFYNKLIITLLLLVAIVVGIVLLWQNDRIEKNQICLQKQATVKAVRSEGGTGNPVDASLWAQSAFGGLLVPDLEPWYPTEPKTDPPIQPPQINPLMICG